MCVCVSYHFDVMLGKSQNKAKLFHALIFRHSVCYYAFYTATKKIYENLDVIKPFFNLKQGLFSLTQSAGFTKLANRMA